MTGGTSEQFSAFGDPVFAQTLTGSTDHAPIVIEDVDTDSRVDASAMHNKSGLFVKCRSRSTWKSAGLQPSIAA